jgi:hypothetical protein
MSLSPIQGAPPYAAIARGLSDAFAVLRELGTLAGKLELGEQASLSARFTLDVASVAEVDGVAAELGAVPQWQDDWTYSATLAGDTAGVTVSFTIIPRDPATVTASIPGGAA